MTTDWPPVIAISPIPCPVAGFASSSAFTTSSVSSRLSAASAPLCRTIASNTACDVASAPVCEAVARAPASVTPPFQTTTGFIEAARRSELTKRGPSFTPSMYIAMTFVSASSAR